jgi:hypothetical protein
MALLIPPNNTCDIYRQGTSPPASPAVAKVAFFLVPKGASSLTTPTYSHKGYFAPTVDIRDDYNNVAAAPVPVGPDFTLVGIEEIIDIGEWFAAGPNADTIYVPSGTASPYTTFAVVLVRRLAKGTAADMLEALLQRQSGTGMTWPNSNL